MVYSHGSTYEGDWKNYKKHGQGIAHHQPRKVKKRELDIFQGVYAEGEWRDNTHVCGKIIHCKNSGETKTCFLKNRCYYPI